jgi:hypothetical protein
MMCGRISSMMDGSWPQQQRGMCFSPSVDEVEIDPFSRPVIRFVPNMHFLCSAGKTGPAESLRGECNCNRGWCFWFHLISQKMQVASKTLITLTVIPSTFQVIRESCKDLVTHWLHTIGGTHVTGRDVGPGSYDGAVVFHLQFLWFYSGL